MAITNLTGGVAPTKTLQEQVCSTTLTAQTHREFIALAAVHIFLFFTALLGNSLILVALHKESSLPPPSKLLYRCLATTDLCVSLIVHPLAATYWMVLVHKDWGLCRHVYDVLYITSLTLCSVSLLTLTAKSVDRLLALLLEMRYTQVVTLKRTYIIVSTFWIVSCVVGLSYILDPRITFWNTSIGAASCLAISFASYTKIFCALRRYNSQVHDHVQQQANQPNALNIARYRKAVYSALWVQLALVVCYLPNSIVTVWITYDGKPLSSHSIAWGVTSLLVYFNSTLNPFLYCWKIREVRQAVKQTIRQALCCPWS